MSDLNSILTKIVNMEGISAAVVVSRDGFVIEGITSGEDSDVDAIGAVISTGVGSSETVGDQLNVGGMVQSLVEYANGIVMMSLIGEEAILAVTTDLKINLGHVRYQVKKIIPELAKIL